MKNELPESPTSVTYSVISAKGYPALVTIRDAEFSKLTVKMEFAEGWFERQGYKPQVKQSFGQKKEVEYVKVNGENMVCPTCKVGHVKIIRSAKGTFYGCDQSKFNPATKTYDGCKFFSTVDPSKAKEEEFEVPDFPADGDTEHL